jgi:hypothetical protein
VWLLLLKYTQHYIYNIYSTSLKHNTANGSSSSNRKKKHEKEKGKKVMFEKGEEKNQRQRRRKRKKGDKKEVREKKIERRNTLPFSVRVLELFLKRWTQKKNLKIKKELGRLCVSGNQKQCVRTTKKR